MYQEIKASLHDLYLEDERPWLVGFSGGKDSTMLASLIFDVVLSIPAEQLRRPIYRLLCTVFPIPAIAEMIEGTLDRMRKCSEQHNLNIEANDVAPGFSPAPNVFGNRICEGWRLDEPGGAGLKAGATKNESFWVNIIGRGYPPPNRTFRWCTQRMKIDPVNNFVKQRIGHWGEAILHHGTRRAEGSTRAQTMAARQTRNGLRWHPDLPRVWRRKFPKIAFSNGSIIILSFTCHARYG